jgi:hypothetical protein
MKRRLDLGLAFALVLSASASARAATPDAVPATTTPAPKLEARVEAGAAVLARGDSTTVVVPDGVVSVHLAGTRLHVALGRGGALVFDVTEASAPRLVGRVPPSDVTITGFDDIGTETWMLVETRRAVPLPPFGTGVLEPPAAPGPTTTTSPVAPTAASASSASASRSPASSPAARPWPTREVRIAAVSPGEVLIDAGKVDGLAVGEWVGVYRVLPASKLRPGFLERQRISVVRVMAVREHESVCELPRGARLRIGDTLERAQAGEDALIYPARQSSMLDLTATLRPLVKVGAPLGGGFLLDGALTYLGGSYFVGARLQPLGLGWTKSGNVVSSSLLAEAGYDSQPFGVGLGVGASMVNGDLTDLLRSGTHEAAPSPDGTSSTWSQRTSTAAALSQNVRLGARDGLHLTLVNVIIYHRPTVGDGGFVYGSTTGRLQVPLFASTDLFAEGGGGYMGYAFGALGVHTWLDGRGDPGSFGLSVAAGGAAVWGSKEVETTTFNGGRFFTRETVTVGGPMVSLGIHYRYGL